MRRKRKQQKWLLEERLRDLQRLEAMEDAVQADGEGPETTGPLTCMWNPGLCSCVFLPLFPRLWLKIRAGQRLHLFFRLPPRGYQGWPLSSLFFPCAWG